MTRVELNTQPPAAEITINEIKALEDRRYRVIDGDTTVLDHVSLRDCDAVTPRL